MQQIEIRKNEAGQRLDKFLHKFMPLAPTSFFYKMLRKKNITLNNKRAEGSEKLMIGDKLSLYLSDETIQNFKKETHTFDEYEKAFHVLKNIEIVYEDEHVILMNKPAGVLSQKAGASDLSLNEWMIGYLLAQKHLGEKELLTFKPSICNRLDRNTMGLVIGAKSLEGSQKMSQLIKEHKIRKFYRMLVMGKVEKEETLEGFLIKDQESNKVRLTTKESKDKSAYIKTRYYPLQVFSDKTLVEAELITGKPHQIRIHLSSTGHPLLGDYKYGNRQWNDKYKKFFSVNSQLLYANRLEFPELKSPFENLSRRRIEIPAPFIFYQIINEELNL